MPTQLQKQFKDLAAKVIKEDYYTHIFAHVLKARFMTIESVNSFKHADEEVVNAAQDFWELLPDSMAIRREPFFEVCNIAEHIFD